MESKALAITGKKWVNGTVPVDSTIGNDTFFVVTWTIQKPEILLQDPKGKKYKTSDFKEDNLNIHSVRLRIPGIAEVKIFFYFLHALSTNFKEKNENNISHGSRKILQKLSNSFFLIFFFFLIFRQVLGLTAF